MGSDKHGLVCLLFFISQLLLVVGYAMLDAAEVILRDTPNSKNKKRIFYLTLARFTR